MRNIYEAIAYLIFFPTLLIYLEWHIRQKTRTTMPRKFDIHEWILAVKYWLLRFIPHISICLIYLFYILIGASIIQEIESEKSEMSSSIKRLQDERERLLIKIIEKRELLDLEQYTKHVYKNIRQYEEELKKYRNIEENGSLNYSYFLFFISTTLTTIGSNDFVPNSRVGKLFLMIYTGLGIPLTLVLLIDLSYLIKKLVRNLYIYFSKYFRRLRRFVFFRFLGTESLNYARNSLYMNKNLTIIQLMVTLFVYLLIGSCFLSPGSFLENFYLSFTSLFTINLNRRIYHNRNLFWIMIYIFFGLPIVFLCIEAVKNRMEIFLTNIGNKMVQNLLELTQQMGFRDLTSEDLIVPISDANSISMPDSPTSRYPQPSRSISLDQSSTLRPIGIAEPLRRLSTGLIRAFTNTDTDDDRHADKNVQVSTIIRRCGRCAETSLPIRPVRRLNAISPSTSSITDGGSSFDEDDDVMDFPPPTLDRIRQRRATLVAKTIINQLATQPRSPSFDEILPEFPMPRSQRPRATNTPPVSMKYSVKISAASPPDSPPKRDSLEEFTEISKQISSLLVPSDDDNDLN